MSGHVWRVVDHDEIMRVYGALGFHPLPTPAEILPGWEVLHSEVQPWTQARRVPNRRQPLRLVPGAADLIAAHVMDTTASADVQAHERSLWAAFVAWLRGPSPWA